MIERVAFWCGWKRRCTSLEECEGCPEKYRGECDPEFELLVALIGGRARCSS
jgi:hypothetical protein